MLKVIGTATIVFFLGVAPLRAGDITTSSGQPLCDTADHLREWLIAALEKQDRWIGELKKSCISLKEGLSVGLIEVVSGDNGIDVLKVRILGKKTGSAVGFTISAGLSGYKSDDE